MNFTATGRSQVRSVKCCVLFDPKNGAILHMHRVVTMEGAAETPDKLVEERTRQLAEGLGLDVASLELLHVDAKVIQPGVKYTVDRGKRSLIAARVPTEAPFPGAATAPGGGARRSGKPRGARAQG
jgi:hypothetical protein